MKRGIARSVLANLVLASASSAWALDPGNYTIKCTSPDSAHSIVETFDIRMDMVDLLTMKYTYGAVISGTRLDDGRRVILTGDRGCALTEVRRRSSRK